MDSTYDKYAHLTIPEIKAELRKRNARLSGRKKELIERLVAYEKNQNFGQDEQLEPEFKMSLPDPSTYLDVNSDSNFVGTSLECLVEYLAKYNKEFDKQIQRLYDERIIRYFRLSHNGDNTYVAASCYAEYRKGISYEVDILLDDLGSVLEAQCECPAGEGPTAHCKHTSTVLYGAFMFKQNKTIKVEETCTQKLQSFHKCKRFLGSPIKTKSLDMPGADEFTNIDFDPRPVHLRNMPGYQDYFRNTCLNFTGVSEMPIFQTFEPASMLGVAHDHDYLKLTPEESFLESIYITKITQEKISAIEERTRGQANNNTWKLERTKRLPSSMFGRICKATERTDMIKLSKSLMEVHDIKTIPLEHGRKHESVAIKKYVEDSCNEVRQCGLIVSIDFPHLASSPDGIVSRGKIIEVKCPYVSRDKPVNENSVPFLKVNTKGQYYLEPTHNYFYQIQGQLLCTGADECTLVVCHADNFIVKDIKYVTVPRDDQFILDMVHKLSEFFNLYFKPQLLKKLFYKPFYS